jgi:hypothetical protein
MRCDMSRETTSVIPSRAGGLLCLLLCAALSACAPVRPKAEPSAVSVAPTAPVVVVEAPPPPPPADEVGPLLRYHQSLRRMSQGELIKELSGLSLQQRSPRVAVQMGMVLMLTRGNGDLARAQALFDGVGNNTNNNNNGNGNDGEAAIFKPLAQMLSSNCAESRRLAEHIEKLAVQQRDNQRRIDQLNDMVEGLKTIERTLPSRPAAGAPQPVIK